MYFSRHPNNLTWLNSILTFKKQYFVLSKVEGSGFLELQMAKLLARKGMDEIDTGVIHTYSHTDDRKGMSEMDTGDMTHSLIDRKGMDEMNKR